MAEPNLTAIKSDLQDGLCRFLPSVDRVWLQDVAKLHSIARAEQLRSSHRCVWAFGFAPTAITVMARIYDKGLAHQPGSPLKLRCSIALCLPVSKQPLWYCDFQSITGSAQDAGSYAYVALHQLGQLRAAVDSGVLQLVTVAHSSLLVDYPPSRCCLCLMAPSLCRPDLTPA